MAEFPRTENDVIALCEAMVAGYTAHPADFPSVDADALTLLSNTLTGYKGLRDDYGDAKSQIRLKTITKEDELDMLVQTMRSYLKRAEADCAEVPEKLLEIGWGPRATPQPVPATPPYQPDLLHITAEGPGDIWFEWDWGGAKSVVNNWIVERRQQLTPEGPFGPWTIAGSSVNLSIHLTDQPRGIQLEYRVKGVNTAGESAPSNTVASVL